MEVKPIKIKNTVIGEGMPKMIISLMGKSEEGLLQEAEEVKSLRPDMIEWRVDEYDEAENKTAVLSLLTNIREKLSDTPLIFTFRTSKEGGNKRISAGYYKELLESAIASKKIDLVDIELFSGETIVKELVAAAHENGVCVIMSNHDFDKTPAKDEIISRLRQMQELGAHIPKIAVMPHSVRDVLTLLDATNTMIENYADRPIMTMAMSEIGVISRLAGEVFGSAATFASGKQLSAPGQIPAEELRKVLNVLHKYT